MNTAHAITERVQLDVTRQLIEEEGQDIVLVRKPALVSDGSGGVERADGADTLLPAVRRFFGSVTRQGELITTPEGQQFVTQHVLIGMPGDDIQQNDEFTVGARTFTVDYVHSRSDYQVKAYVSNHAKP